MKQDYIPVDTYEIIKQSYPDDIDILVVDDVIYNILGL